MDCALVNFEASGSMQTSGCPETSNPSPRPMVTPGPDLPRELQLRRCVLLRQAASPRTCKYSKQLWNQVDSLSLQRRRLVQVRGIPSNYGSALSFAFSVCGYGLSLSSLFYSFVLMLAKYILCCFLPCSCGGTRTRHRRFNVWELQATCANSLGPKVCTKTSDTLSFGMSRGCSLDKLCEKSPI